MLSVAIYRKALVCKGVGNPDLKKHGPLESLGNARKQLTTMGAILIFIRITKYSVPGVYYNKISESHVNRKGFR